MQAKIAAPLAVLTMVVCLAGTSSQAAHFSVTGTPELHVTSGVSFTQFQWCNFTYDKVQNTLTIDPDPTESIGDPVTVNYCYSVIGSTTTPGSRYVTIGGVGDATSFSVGCLPAPAYVPSSSPATLILNPGAGQTVIATYGPQVLTGNQTVTLTNQCGSFPAHVGDSLQANAGTFVLLYDTQYQGPNPDAGGSGAINYTFDATINGPVAGEAIPTLTEWGMVALIVLAALGAVYYLRRPRSAEA